jgi:hypothetical protein
MAKDNGTHAHRPDGFTPETLGLADDLKSGDLLLRGASAGCATLDARLGRNSLWLVIRTGGAALALRTAHAATRLTVKTAASKDAICAFAAHSPEGDFRVTAELKGERLLRVRTWLTPKTPMLVPFWPRDLYPLGAGDDPIKARGEVIAAQRGFNAAVLFLRMDAADAAALYFQNLTALVPWFKATGSRPDGCVGGVWPELGYQPPASPEGPSPPKKPLPAGKEILISDAFIALCPTAPRGEQEEADFFLEGLAALYPHIDKPRPEFRDWPGLAERSLRDLSRSPKATVSRYGHTYVRPYVDAEVPDSMVQLAVLLPVMDYGAWRQRPVPLVKPMRAGVDKFFDAKLGAIRRFLPNIADGTETIPKAKDKDPKEVDSWYLYHPLGNLGRLALEGDADARRLFLGSMDYAIKVARHYKYAWPVLFDVMSLKVKVQSRKPGGPGQSDVGGLYAYVMIQAHELTGQQRFLDEAGKALRATQGLGFELLYQTNLTAWAVVACVKLWRLTGNDFFRRQSHLFLAGFFHNTIFWESELGTAQHYQTFLGATCLHDGPYMAIYECFESFEAFREYLEMADEGLPPWLRLLLNEYCRYALSRAWGFYPANLPKEILAGDIRNGELDPALAFPVEDLYAGGDRPGQIGQEIYGSGAAFAFTKHAFARLKGCPVMVFCDYPIKDGTFGQGRWSGRIDGWPEGQCRLRVIAAPGTIHVVSITVDGKARKPTRAAPGSWEIDAPGRAAVEVRWRLDRIA